MQTQVRPWMLAYTILFGLFCIRGSYDAVAKHYPLVIIAEGWICSIVIFVGNLLYSLRRVPSSFRTPWKVVFPFLVLDFVFGGIYDMQHGRHAHDIDVSQLPLVVLVWLFSALLFLPTFKAHYLIGYGKRAGNSLG